MDPGLPAGEKITLVLEAIGDDKIRVNSPSLDHPLVILAGRFGPAAVVSLFVGKMFADIHLNFLVPLCREFVRKPLNLIVDWTRESRRKADFGEAKPATKTDHRLNSAEAWLAEVVADHRCRSLRMSNFAQTPP